MAAGEVVTPLEELSWAAWWLLPGAGAKVHVVGARPLSFDGSLVSVIM